jgi:hypothetical protein
MFSCGENFYNILAAEEEKCVVNKAGERSCRIRISPIKGLNTKVIL